MTLSRGQNGTIRYTVELPAEHADRAAALEQSLRAAGFDFAPAREADDADDPSGVDPMTGLPDRHAAFSRLREVWSLSVRHGEPLSCLVLSIDQTRCINASHGVGAGDHALLEAARMIRALARVEELVFRLDGNEFLILCPKSTAHSAAIGAERQRWALQSAALAWERTTLPITVSIGVAERTNDMTHADQLVARAADAARQAKLAGGNRIHIVGQTSAPLDHAMLHAAMFANPVPREPQHKSHTGQVLVLHHPGDEPTLLCTTLTHLGFSVRAMTAGAFEPALCTGDELPVIVAVLDQSPADWRSVIRLIRGNAQSHLAPIVLCGEPSMEETASALISEGAQGFVASTEAPRLLGLLMSALMHNASLEQQLAENRAMRAEQARMLTALFDLARAFTTADTLERCLHRLMQIAAELLGAEHVSVLVANRDRSGMSLARTRGDYIELEDLAPGALRDGLISRACHRREMLMIAELERVREQFSPTDRELIVNAPAAIAPMITGQRVVGVLIACADTQRGAFKPWEVAMLDLLSNIAAASIDDHHARTARDDAREAIVVALAKLTQHRDGPTAEHVDRVGRICVMLARDLANSTPDEFPEIDDAFITNLEWAVPLHDIGKVGLPDHILLKPGRLTDEEMDIMRSHVNIGQSALQSISARVPEAEYLRMAESIAHYHHEWFDGSGYPDGLAGEAIPLAARIASVADAYDAITSSRCYKNAVAHDEACEEIRKRAGSQFDPRIVESFLRCQHMFTAIAGHHDCAIPDQHADAA